MNWCAPVRWGTLPAGGEGVSLRADGDASASAEGEHAENRAPYAHELRSSRAGEPRGLTSQVRMIDTSDEAWGEEETRGEPPGRANRGEVVLGLERFPALSPFLAFQVEASARFQPDTGSRRDSHVEVMSTRLLHASR